MARFHTTLGNNTVVFDNKVNGKLIPPQDAFDMIVEGTLKPVSVKPTPPIKPAPLPQKGKKNG